MGLKPEFTKQNKQTNQNQKHIALKIIANPNLASRMRDFTFRQCGVAQTLHSSAKYNCYCSVSTLCPTLCNPMNCSIPAFPVLHYFPEFTQTHVHWVSDAIQPSHPLLHTCNAGNNTKGSKGKLKVGKKEVNWLESSRLEIILQSLTQHKSQCRHSVFQFPSSNRKWAG